MTRNELIEILEQTANALEQYREAPSVKQASAAKKISIRESTQKAQLEKAIESLIKEAFMLGPSGRTCPQCGGSGRI